mmetsp:Transcript_31599/g.66908  ORF Transcript_31599/g.66908 Transcript_31599/m.66908 type:complete len:86 (+) Transcript_31599:104-361(+)
MIPARLNGAKLDKFFIRHNGRRTVSVNPINATSRLTDMPNVLNKALNVSPRTTLNVKIAKNVIMSQDDPGIQDVDSPTDFSHAPR